MKPTKKFISFALALVMCLSLLPMTAMAATVGETIQFGGYDWRVLDVQDGKALILSDKVIDKQPYDDFSSDGTDWETSTLRAYLNNDFYNSFSENDKAMILETAVINNDNPWYNFEGNSALGGNDTKDKIFLLSLEEVVKYFGDSGTLAAGSEANGHDANINDEYNEARIAYNAEGTACWWWLRSVGTNNMSAARIHEQGGIAVNGINMGGGGSDEWARGVRPAMWIAANGGTATTPPPTTPTEPTAPVTTPTASAQESKTVNPTASKVFVNGAEKSFEAYNIDGSNYFKLRDVAFVLNGTSKPFEVGYDNATKAITMTSGQPYTPTGGEMTVGDGQAYVYNAISGAFTPQVAIGMVDAKGHVYDGIPGMVNLRVAIGEAEGPNCRAGGAALLLLLLPHKKERECSNAPGYPVSFPTTPPKTSYYPQPKTGRIAVSQHMSENTF